jgi:flavin reductase (DIM6/NTAB) family NADH-FMN oxidoreductase RutF
VNVDAASTVFDQLDREIWLVTSRSGDRASGLVATYISRVSLVPSQPRVTLALAKHHFTHQLIEASNSFCLHLIDEHHIDWVWRFGILSGREIDKFRGLAIHPSVSGAPILADSLAWLDCRVEARMDTGDRTVYLAEVLDAHAGLAHAPLRLKRLSELAPADKIEQIKHAQERDIELDHQAILEWRQRASVAPA